MDSTKHFITSILLTLLIIVLGTTGYMIIEGWDIFDSLYMTVITITSVGYGEVHEIGKAGRLFTVFLIIIGIGFVIYVAGAVVQFMLEGQIRTILGRRRLDKKIDRLRNHYIICGYGRIGRLLCKNIQKKSIGLVVIEKNEKLREVMDKDGILYVLGNAADETTLINAGVKHAKSLVAVLGTDTDNVFLVLTARQLKPDLHITARACHDETKAKLRAAGANKVESPYDIGALSMAQRILRPAVTNFLDQALDDQRQDIHMEEMSVSPSSSLINLMLKDSGIRQNYNLIIIAIKKLGGAMLFNPSFESIIKAGDILIAVGKTENLQKLEEVLNP
ncbi:MAG: potassium channel protein [Thermodesulfobacteriota bacterium]|nr:potassium channel protein [Thermodesulfobacteriota bacterium]